MTALSLVLFLAAPAQAEAPPPAAPVEAPASAAASESAPQPESAGGDEPWKLEPVAPTAAPDLAPPGLVAPVPVPVAPTPTPEPAPEKGLPAPTAPRLLVMDLIDKGAGPEIVNGINDAVANQATKSHAGEVVTTTQLRVALEASEVQSLLGCDTDACMVELGQTAQASLVLGGNVTKVGNDVLITILALDTRDGTRVGESQRKVPLHQDLYYYAARQLTSIALTGRSVESTVPVMVQASEPGAKVFVDGAQVGEAPVTIPLDPGNHEVKIEADGFSDWRTLITVEEATPLELKADLSATRIPLWPVAVVLAVVGGGFGTAATLGALATQDQYNGAITSPLGLDRRKDSYIGVTPADTATLAQKQQQVQQLALVTDVLWVTTGLTFTVAAAFEVADIIIWAVWE